MYETFIESVPLLKSLEVSICYFNSTLRNSNCSSVNSLMTEKRELYLIAKEMAHVYKPVISHLFLPR